VIKENDIKIVELSFPDGNYPPKKIIS